MKSMPMQTLLDRLLATMKSFWIKMSVGFSKTDRLNANQGMARDCLNEVQRKVSYIQNHMIGNFTET